MGMRPRLRERTGLVVEGLGTGTGAGGTGAGGAGAGGAGARGASFSGARTGLRPRGRSTLRDRSVRASLALGLTAAPGGGGGGGKDLELLAMASSGGFDWDLSLPGVLMFTCCTV